MVKIISNKSTISQTGQVVYDYLSVPANYEILMPSKVRSFESTENTAILDIEGIGKIELAITERIAPNKIVMVPQNKVPFKFDLNWEITTIDAEITEVQATINADLNFMMKMMAEGLLKDFLNVQVHKLTAHLNK
jgi:hypothetical protein